MLAVRDVDVGRLLAWGEATYGESLGQITVIVCRDRLSLAEILPDVRLPEDPRGMWAGDPATDEDRPIGTIYLVAGAHEDLDELRDTFEHELLHALGLDESELDGFEE
jgi:hypothetical protein